MSYHDEEWRRICCKHGWDWRDAPCDHELSDAELNDLSKAFEYDMNAYYESEWSSEYASYMY